MPPAWRLARNSLDARRKRTALLVLAVALASALIAAVACASSTVTATLAHRVNATVGVADLRVRAVNDKPFDAAALAIIRQWDEARVVAPRARGPIPLLNANAEGEDLRAVAIGHGIDPAAEAALRAPTMAEGRALAADGEVVIDQALAEELDVGVGATLDVERFGDPFTLVVVGILEREPIGTLAAAHRFEAYVTIRDLGEITNEPDRLDQIDIALRSPDRAASITPPDGFPEGLILQPTERLTSGLDRSVQSSRFGLLIAAVLTFIAAAFIILTGLTTNLSERTRELAMLRCIGAARGQLARAQLLVGMLVGFLGGALGAPFGVFLAFLLATIFSDRLPGGFVLSWFGVALAVLGALLAGLLGALWPAWSAARVRPLQALASRAAKPRPRTLAFAFLGGCALLAAQVAIVLLAPDGQTLFWLYATAALPLMMVGYFLLGPPVTAIVTLALAPLVERALRLPKGLLRSSVLSTPFRNGFTAAALMVGLAMMTALWTEGRAFLGWVDRIQFPDAFAHGWLGIDDDARERVDELPFVNETCAITLLRIDSEFGVRALNPLKTSFVAFEPEPFFAMTRLTWDEGSLEEALPKLQQGGAILVAREFKIARGYGVGDTYTVSHNGEDHTFEIVGVISSPGLDIASKYFDIGQEYYSQAIHAVFGTRADLQRLFGVDTINLIQIDLDDSVPDREAMKQVRAALGSSLLVVGSGREIKDLINSVGGGTLRVMSFVAFGAMGIACLGVGNIVVAAIDARRFEFGVLRAIGGDRTLVVRLVLAEILLVAFSACVLGAGLGLQHAWGAANMNRLLAGVELHLRPPVGPMLVGCVALVALALIAAAIPLRSLFRQSPRDLLGVVRG
ncbi:MAG: FtsX-like permease family protein [Phycisphaerales bacterium]